MSISELNVGCWVRGRLARQYSSQPVTTAVSTTHVTHRRSHEGRSGCTASLRSAVMWRAATLRLVHAMANPAATMGTAVTMLAAHVNGRVDASAA